jgi:hypothetical protein
VAAEASGGDTIAPSKNATGQGTPSPKARTASATSVVVKENKPECQQEDRPAILFEVSPRGEIGGGEQNLAEERA